MKASIIDIFPQDKLSNYSHLPLPYLKAKPITAQTKQKKRKKKKLDAALIELIIFKMLKQQVLIGKMETCYFFPAQHLKQVEKSNSINREFTLRLFYLFIYFLFNNPSRRMK